MREDKRARGAIASTVTTRRFALAASELALLLEVRVSDEDHGGLCDLELAAAEYEAMHRLCSLGLVEAVGEYGEAPDGEEDEREAGGSSAVYRITAWGVMVLADEHPS